MSNNPLKYVDPLGLQQKCTNLPNSCPAKKTQDPSASFYFTSGGIIGQNAIDNPPHGGVSINAGPQPDTSAITGFYAANPATLGGIMGGKGIIRPDDVSTFQGQVTVPLSEGGYIGANVAALTFTSRNPNYYATTNNCFSYQLDVAEGAALGASIQAIMEATGALKKR